MRTDTIFVSRVLKDEVCSRLFRHLENDVAPEVSKKISRGGQEWCIRFKDASPQTPELIDKQISERILGCDLFMALAIPRKGQSELSPWVAAELGFAFAHEKPMTAIYCAPIPRKSLTFAVQRGVEVLAIDPSDLEGKIPAKLHHALVKWVYEWVNQQLTFVVQQRPYFQRKLVKDVTVYPDGYGLVRYRTITEVVRPLSALHHQFGARRPGRGPESAPLGNLKRAFRGKAGARRDMFNFLSLGGEQRLRLGRTGTRSKAYQEFEKRNLAPMPGNVKERWYFDVIADGRDQIPPGRYEYEWCFGLADLFDPAGDDTMVSLRPIRVMDCMLVLRFRHGRAGEDFLNRINLVLETGPVGHEEKIEPTIQTNSLETTFVYRSAIRPPTDSSIKARWTVKARRKSPPLVR